MTAHKYFSHNFFKNIRVLVTRSGLPLGKEVIKELQQLQKFEIVACQNPGKDLINQEPFDIIIHLAGFDPPSFAETLYHTSILHQLLDLCLRHKAKIILVLPLVPSSLKDVAVSLVKQFNKLFKVDYFLVEVGEKDNLTDSASEILKKFVHQSHRQKLKRVTVVEQPPVVKKPAPPWLKGLLVTLIVGSSLHLLFLTQTWIGKSLVVCSQSSLQAGLWKKTRDCAQAALFVASITPDVYKSKTNMTLPKLFSDLSTIGEAGQQLLTGKSEDISNFSNQLSYAQEQIAQAQLDIQDEALQTKFVEWRLLLARLRTAVEDSGVLLGMTRPVSYLVLLQDANELRPTGGFIDSLAVVSVTAGKIEDIQLLTAYAADGQMKGLVEPPADLKKSLGENNWYLRDSNWDPDFTKSAVRAAWFVNKQLNKQVDFVVGMNTQTLSQLVDLVSPGQGKMLSAQGLASATTDFTKSSFYLQTLEKTLSGIQDSSFDKVGQLGAIILGALENRQMFIAPTGNLSLPNLAAAGWDGALNLPVCQAAVPCISDTVYVVNSNVGVNKVNSAISQKTLLDVDFELTLAKASLNVVYSNLSPNQNWPLGNYKNFVRIYLPERAQVSRVVIGDKIQPPTSYEINFVGGWTVVGLLVEVPVGQSVPLGINFQRGLPTTQKFAYNLSVLNQPGVQEGTLGVTLRYPTRWSVSTTKPAAVAAAGLLRYNADKAKPFRVALEFLRNE